MIVRNASFPGPGPMAGKAPAKPANIGQQLAAELREVCRLRQISPTQLSWMVARDGQFLFSLERGRVPRARMTERVRRKLAELAAASE